MVGLFRISLPFVACAVTTQPQALLGLDIEETLSFAVARSTQAMVGTPDEWALLLEKIKLTQAVTLLFSAKQCVFKAWFPLDQSLARAIYLARSVGVDDGF
ncbi:4'-phosphopantetheinyl transferase superfamily protein [Vibrio navarrensis]|uniref:4'-phosphopantetheinyl transferase superfamily protein n=1 Tax=Vibrio navarrensis TaxID=29495 RepID=UPI0013021B10|nr:4'-phosphopantetheinyl transferase superfamily protein [Vibrio navarrensis]